MILFDLIGVIVLGGIIALGIKTAVEKFKGAKQESENEPK